MYPQSTVEDSPPFGGRGIPFYLSQFVSILGNLYPNRGGKRAIFGYVWKNGPVQEDINPGIYISDLTPLVYKNPTFYRSIFFLMIWKESYRSLKLIDFHFCQKIWYCPRLG